MIYSGIPHPTAAIFLAGSFIETHERIFILTDDHKTKDYIREVGSWIWGCPVRILESPGELLVLNQYDERVIVIHTELMRVSGNLEQIKRTMTIELIRDTFFAQNTLIEKLLEFGYRQSDYPGESGTYKREGSIIRVWREDREYLIEYFDDVIESILDISSSARLHRDRLLLTSEIPYTIEQLPDLSNELISLISATPTILIGCEFLREREYIIANIRNISEYSSITRE